MLNKIFDAKRARQLTDEINARHREELLSMIDICVDRCLLACYRRIQQFSNCGYAMCRISHKDCYFQSCRVCEQSNIDMSGRDFVQSSIFEKVAERLRTDGYKVNKYVSEYITGDSGISIAW